MSGAVVAAGGGAGPDGPGGRPDPQLAWQAWQTAFGCVGFPAGEQAARLEPALLKAVRESGLFTSWTEPDPGYERAVSDFVAAGPAAATGPVRALLEGSRARSPRRCGPMCSARRWCS